MVRKGNLAKIESSDISKTREATPTKIGLHAFPIQLYLHKFFEPILFFDPPPPMDYYHYTKNKTVFTKKTMSKLCHALHYGTTN